MEIAERLHRRKPYKRALKTGENHGKRGKTTPSIEFEKEVKGEFGEKA
ncbi:hypothetical protein IBX38_06805 [Candidatus Bathyarchaeota archaeon]|nr:hypothetical protein [Candidatus Bathyarchaeota archaeon]